MPEQAGTASPTVTHRQRERPPTHKAEDPTSSRARNSAASPVLLIGALITHWRALDSAKEMAPALLAVAITLAYLAIALTS